MIEKQSEVLRVAQELFQKNNTDWVTFFRAVLGVGGLVREAYPAPEELCKFEQSKEYLEIQLMVAKLRERSGTLPQPQEPTRVITVRLPQSLHEALRSEAHDRRTSMNQLCISKLLQMIDEQLVPTDVPASARVAANTQPTTESEEEMRMPEAAVA